MGVLFYIISIVWSILCILLFIKIWKMTNDVEKLRASLVDDNGSAIPKMNHEDLLSSIKRNYYLGKVEAAYDDLNLFTYQQILLAHNCYEYDGSIHVVVNGELKAFKNRQKYVEYVLENVKPLYEEIGRTVPKQLAELKYEDFMRFGKVGGKAE